MERVKYISRIVPMLDRVAKKNRIFLGLMTDVCLKLLDRLVTSLPFVGVPVAVVVVVPLVMMLIWWCTCGSVIPTITFGEEIASLSLSTLGLLIFLSSPFLDKLLCKLNLELKLRSLVVR